MINYGRKIVADEKIVNKLGMTEAIIIQLVDEETTKSTNTHDSKKWVCKSLKDWHKKISWVALSTLKRAFSELEKQGLLITGNFNKTKYDKTKWYRVDYEKIDELIKGSKEA
ncbi:hypothetical protein [Lactobacillus sp. ESL0230]|uniref:hypothetical protein n=1 Tax=Lactobacillus sp. ESL0230 TaxID=2069353 RepID=UPI000EFB5939|nr:hypothetical protein [Lactobacillus sp. ESL0230]RMC46552.1 hypothetical protein F5ESL0230_04660 [Lactobacillus sp. ESL0230]